MGLWSRGFFFIFIFIFEGKKILGEKSASRPPRTSFGLHLPHPLLHRLPVFLLRSEVRLHQRELDPRRHRARYSYYRCARSVLDAIDLHHCALQHRSPVRYLWVPVRYRDPPRVRWEALFCLIPMLRGSAILAFVNTSAVRMLEKQVSWKCPNDIASFAI